jgi:transposase
LQDGDPNQNSRKAKLAMSAVGARNFTIPARSPDLNPIENVFHNVKRQLQDDALSKRITKETYSQFCTRVKVTLLNYLPDILDRTIESMDKRIDMVIKSKGQHIKY